MNKNNRSPLLLALTSLVACLLIPGAAAAASPDHWDNSPSSPQGMGTSSKDYNKNKPFTIQGKPTSSERQGSGTVGDSAASPNTAAGMSPMEAQRMKGSLVKSIYNGENAPE